MGRAVLQIVVEGAADLQRAMGTIRGVTRQAQAAMTADARREGQARVRAASEEARRETELARQVAAERKKSERDAARAAAEEARKRSADAKKSAADVARAQRDQTRETEKETRKRVRAEAQFASEVDRIHRSLAAARARRERDQTRETEREAKRRSALAAREGRQEAGSLRRTIGAAGSFAWQTGGAAHGMIQDARQQRAAMETDLNSTFIQTGAGGAEIGRSRSRVLGFARENRLDRSVVIDALREVQSSRNALGGSTEAARTEALEQTLRDVEFASIIDPRNVRGLTSFSGMLRQQGVGGTTRQQILRSAAGISFEGSVEAEQALSQGLPGMLRSLSSATANVAPGQRDAVTRTVVTDFLAQLQTVAATGGSVSVTSNRVNTLRTALSNTDRQNRLGSALADRQMTDAQRTEFNAAFRRDRSGRYTLTENVVNSPSRFAGLMGRLFNNDATAVANFLGPGGGGGRRQLLNRPETGLTTSYFAMGTDAQGRSMRQYEAVESLARQTLTPEREAEIRAVRATEDSRNLIENESKRLDALGENTGALLGLSNRLAELQSGSPILSGALGAGIPTLGGGLLGRAFGGRGGGAAAGAAAGAGRAGLLGRALPWLRGIGTAAASFFGGQAVIEGVAGQDVEQTQLLASNPREFARRYPQAARGTLREIESGRGGGMSSADVARLVQAIREGLAGATITVDPHTAQQAASEASTRNPPSAP